MEIQETPGNYERQAYMGETAENRQPDVREHGPAEQKNQMSGDEITVSLSPASKEIQTEEGAVASAQETAPEEVEAATKAINEGSYEVNAEQVAGNMVGSVISDYV